LIYSLFASFLCPLQVLALHILADAKDHPGRLAATKFGRFRDFGALRGPFASYSAWHPLQ
jgi:hypothetical protein